MASDPGNAGLSAHAAAADRDELLSCLIILARAHGETITRDGALAGLPLDAGRLTPSLFERAAHRAGLSSKVVRQPIDAGSWRQAWQSILPFVGMDEWSQVDTFLASSPTSVEWLERFVKACVQINNEENGDEPEA